MWWEGGRRGGKRALITVAVNFKALQWLRGPKCDVRPELESILSSSSRPPPPKSMEEEDEVAEEDEEG